MYLSRLFIIFFMFLLIVYFVHSCLHVGMAIKYLDLEIYNSDTWWWFVLWHQRNIPTRIEKLEKLNKLVILVIFFVSKVLQKPKGLIVTT